MVRLVLLSAVVALVAATGAMAQGTGAGGDGGDPYGVPEPVVTSSEVLKFRAGASGCGSSRSATVRITPPLGAVLGWVHVRVRGERVVRLTGIPRAASVTVHVPREGGRVTATAETLGGQSLRSSRVYQDCVRPTPPPASLPPVSGGGDG
jgi:hypothetical protein